MAPSSNYSHESKLNNFYETNRDLYCECILCVELSQSNSREEKKELPNFTLKVKRRQWNKTNQNDAITSK